MGHVYVFLTTEGTNISVKLIKVSEERKQAIDQFALWCLRKWNCQKEERDHCVSWCQMNVDKNITKTSQWATIMARHGVRMLVETMYSTRLSPCKTKGHWKCATSGACYEVVSRSWSYPGSNRRKSLDLAFDLLSKHKTVYIYHVANADVLYEPVVETQKKLIGMLKENDVHFVSTRETLQSLGYVNKKELSSIIHF